MRPLRIALAPIGTRGDVQPMLALGIALRARGHGVTVCAPANFEGWVTSLGLEFRSACSDFAALFESPDETRMVRQVATEAGAIFSNLHQVCADADLLVGAMLQIAGPSVAAARRIPYAYVLYAPSFGLPSDELPPAGTPWHGMPRWLNALCWRVGERVWDLCGARRSTAKGPRSGCHRSTVYPVICSTLARCSWQLIRCWLHRLRR